MSIKLFNTEISFDYKRMFESVKYYITYCYNILKSFDTSLILINAILILNIINYNINNIIIIFIDIGVLLYYILNLYFSIDYLKYHVIPLLVFNYILDENFKSTAINYPTEKKYKLFSAIYDILDVSPELNKKKEDFKYIIDQIKFKLESEKCLESYNEKLLNENFDESLNTKSEKIESNKSLKSDNREPLNKNFNDVSLNTKQEKIESNKSLEFDRKLTDTTSIIEEKNVINTTNLSQKQINQINNYQNNI